MQADRMAAGGAQDTSNSHSGRALLVLGAGVVLAHLVALQQLPAVLAPPDLAQTRAFTTRSIVVQPPPAPVAAAAEPAPAPPPPPVRKKPRPAPPAPEPAAPVAAPPPADAMPEPVAAEPAPPDAAVAQAPQEAASQAEPPAPAASAAQAAAAAAQEPPAPTASATALALGIPGSVRLKYTLTGEAKQQTYHALGELLWLQDGKTYDARLEYSAFLIGSRVRTSSGKLGDRGLEPMRFSDKWRKRDLAAHFERDKGVVSFSANTPSAPLLPDAQDQLSVLLQLSAMVAGDPARFGAGASLTLPVVGPRDADVWTFTMQGEELSYLPYDNLQTLKLTRNPRKEFDQKVEAWLAPSLAYMPVRVRITQPNGDFVDQLLRSVDSP